MLVSMLTSKYLTEHLPNGNAKCELTEYPADRLFKTLKPAEGGGTDEIPWI